MVDIIVAIVVGVASVLGVVITNKTSNDKVQIQLKEQQAVTSTEIKELEKKVDKHNKFAEKMPALEERMESYGHRISNAEADIKDLQKKK